MAEQAKVPSIRFAGFTDPWEQRKLGEVAHFINGRAYSQNELLFSGKYPVLRVGNFYTNDSWYYSDLELEDKNYAYEGDLLYTWSATFGPHIWHGNKVIYHYHIWKVQLEAALEKLFAFQLLERDKERILSDKNGSTMVHITKTGIENTSVLMPCSVEEQRRIGAFFDHLDSIITLHQRKYDKLVIFKKSMLEKMFPKDGESVPEIRFAGFTDPWEQRKLGEIASFSKGSGYSKADIRESGIPLFLYGRMYTQYETRVDSVDTFAAPRPGTLYSKGTEIVVPASGESAEDIARASAITREGIALGGDLNVVYPQRMVTPLFLAYGLSHGSSQKLLAQKAQGKTIVHIHASDLKGLGIAFPDVTEQQAIGTFFSSLDDLITLHQRKLELLRNIKKSLLDKMFV